ncbi:MAG: hypothetical protein RL514_4435 [Verrucomicrobiota bacterium]|jgi:hypothetical protein
MNKEEFAELLRRVSAKNREFASTLVHNSLPESSRYFVHLNQSFDDNPLTADERVFPGDSAKFGERVGPLIAASVVDLLWRDGLLPEWVDISPIRADTEHTYFQLLCCGRFTADDSRFYYVSRGQGPFGVKSPWLPPNWSKEQGRFDLHWHLQR